MSEPAPGRLELLERFVNYVDPETDEDDWATPGQLSDWMADNGLLVRGTELTQGDVQRATALREAVRELGRVNDGIEPDQAMLSPLAREARDAPIGFLVSPDGHPVLAPLGEGLDGALGTVLAVLATAVCRRQLGANEGLPQR